MNPGGNGEMTEAEWDALREFHGHLGPWLVLGIKIGRAALAALDARRHFGVEVVARCPDAPPPSCLVDGLQWGTGATYGKRNIVLEPSRDYSVLVRNRDTGESVVARLLPDTADRIRALFDDLGDELSSRRIWETPDQELFALGPTA